MMHRPQTQPSLLPLHQSPQVKFGVWLALVYLVWSSAGHAQEPVIVTPQVATQAASQAATQSAGEGSVKAWPPEVRQIEYRSRADDSLQKALYYAPPASRGRPLLVALHSWSGDYTQANPEYAQWCIERQWVMIHPNFRGVNDHPEACGSELVVADILSAVEHCRQQAQVDEKRIYLIGASGGGYASLLMAGRAPHVWAAVSAWCPIHDLRRWHADTTRRQLRYAKMLEQVCGGAPGTSPEVDQQYRQRSASTWLPSAAQVRLSINTGITDGHDGSVPVGHSLRAFNDVAQPEDRFSEQEIAHIEAAPHMPPELLTDVADLAFGAKRVLLRRASGTAEVTIFQGGHEIIYPAGLAWLAEH